MTDSGLTCWKCGTAIGEIPLPLGRMAKCRSCNADLHTCRMCVFFDRTVSRQCREPIAEEVKDKTRSNFCGYLQPNPGAYTEKDETGPRAAQEKLDALFGLSPGPESPSPSDPDDARQKLDALFGIDKK